MSDNYTPLFKIDALEKTEASQISRSSEQWVDWNWTNTLNYITTIAKKHNLNVMAGFTSERFADYTVSASREGVPSDIETLREVSAGTTAQKAYGNTSFNTLVSYLGRIMYNYDGRYYLTATMRADGTMLPLLSVQTVLPSSPKATSGPPSPLFLLHGASRARSS